MDPVSFAVFAGGALMAGFVSGLTGLGTTLIALSVWLHVAPPILAVPMAAAVAVAAHLTTLAFVRHGIVWARLWPFLACGLIGLPLGIALLPALETVWVKRGLGGFLVLYATYGLAVRVPPRVAGGGRLADGLVGLGGGFLGGLIGASGPLPTIWAGLRGWPKDEQRGVFQPFNLVILLVTATGHLSLGRVGTEALPVLAVALACGVAGAGVGLLVYRRASDAQFRRAVLVLLGMAGVLLLGF